MPQKAPTVWYAKLGRNTRMFLSRSFSSFFSRHIAPWPVVGCGGARSGTVHVHKSSTGQLSLANRVLSGEAEGGGGVFLAAVEKTTHRGGTAVAAEGRCVFLVVLEKTTHCGGMASGKGQRHGREGRGESYFKLLPSYSGE